MALRRLPVVLAVALAGLALPALGCSAEPQATTIHTQAVGPGAPPSPADAAFGEKVRAYLMDHPEVIQDAMNRLQEVQEQRLALAAASAIADNRSALERDVRDPILGRVAAPVTVTEFFDYRCPYCKVAAPQLAAFLERHKNVRVVFKEFPILSEASEHAARLALAAQLQGKYQGVHVALMTTPQLNDAVIDDILKSHGVDVARAHRDAASKPVEDHIADVKKLARTLAVTGTPAFIVGDKVSNGWSPEELDEFIALAEKDGGRKTASLDR